MCESVQGRDLVNDKGKYEVKKLFERQLSMESDYITDNDDRILRTVYMSPLFNLLCCPLYFLCIDL